MHEITAHYDKGVTRVLLSCGPMTDRQCASVSAVTDQLNAEGYMAAYTPALLPESPNGCKGCILHPTKDEDAAMADLIAPVLKKLAGW